MDSSHISLSSDLNGTEIKLYIDSKVERDNELRSAILQLRDVFLCLDLSLHLVFVSLFGYIINLPKLNFYFLSNYDHCGMIWSTTNLLVPTLRCLLHVFKIIL